MASFWCVAYQRGTENGKLSVLILISQCADVHSQMLSIALAKRCHPTFRTP